MLGEVNATVSEIRLELEIIVLESYETTSTYLDVQTEEIAAPTTPILAAYDDLLRELLPEIGSLDNSVSRVSSVLAQRTDATYTQFSEKEQDGSSSEATGRSRQGSTRSGALSASLLILGALFAGVGFAANRMAQAAEQERERQYENLL
jgi:hypothetical protein